MADGPWRCSQCGTVNEPVANSCRTCGRWPSLFDLEASIVDEAEVVDRRAPTGAYVPEQGPEPLEPPPFEPETFETEPIEPAPMEAKQYELEPEVDEGDEEGSRRRRTWTSLIVPIAFAVYILISIVFGDR